MSDGRGDFVKGQGTPIGKVGVERVKWVLVADISPIVIIFNHCPTLKEYNLEYSGLRVKVRGGANA